MIDQTTPNISQEMNKISFQVNFPSTHKSKCLTQTMSNSNIMNQCQLYITIESPTNVPYTSNILYTSLPVMLQVFYSSDGQTESHSYLIPIENKNGFSSAPNKANEEYEFISPDQLISSEFQPSTFVFMSDSSIDI